MVTKAQQLQQMRKDSDWNALELRNRCLQQLDIAVIGDGPWGERFEFEDGSVVHIMGETVTFEVPLGDSK